MMDFPAYVPAAVREHISVILEGEPGMDGLLVALAEIDERLKAVEAEIAARIERGEIHRLDDLQRQKAEAIESRGSFAPRVNAV